MDPLTTVTASGAGVTVKVVLVSVTDLKPAFPAKA
jgi:hypothetical protein